MKFRFNDSHQKKSKFYLVICSLFRTFAPAFRRNRWQEVTRGLLCYVGTITTNLKFKSNNGFD